MKKLPLCFLILVLTLTQLTRYLTKISLTAKFTFVYLFDDLQYFITLCLELNKANKVFTKKKIICTIYFFMFFVVDLQFFFIFSVKS